MATYKDPLKSNKRTTLDPLNPNAKPIGKKPVVQEKPVQQIATAPKKGGFSFDNLLPKAQSGLNIVKNKIDSVPIVKKTLGTLGKNILNTTPIGTANNLLKATGTNLNKVIGTEGWKEYNDTHKEVPNVVKPLGFFAESGNRIPLVQRAKVSAGNYLGNPAMNFDGSNMEAKTSGNKILDKVADFGGGLAGQALVGDGNINMLSATDDIAQYAGARISPKLLKGPGQLLPSMIRGATDSATGTVLEDIGQGKNLKDTAKDTAFNAAFGAGLFGLGKIGSEVLQGRGTDLITTSTNTYGSGINKIDNAQAKTFRQGENLVKKEGLPQLPSPRDYTQKVNELPNDSSVISMGGTTPYKGSYSVKNTDLPKAQQAYDEAVQEIQNYWGHWKLDEAEIRLGAEELGINLDKILNDLDHAEVQGVDVRGIGERQRLAQVAGVSKVEPRPLEPYRTKASIQLPQNPNTNSGIAMQLPIKPQNSVKPNLDINSQALKKKSPTALNSGIESPNVQTPKYKHSQESISKIENVEEMDNVINQLKEEVAATTDNNFKGLIMNLQIFAEKKKAELRSKIKTPSAAMTAGENPLTDLKIENWKDKSKFSYNRETMERNFQDIAGEDAPKVVKRYIEPIKTNEATSIREKNTMREQVKSFGIKAGSKESELMQKYGEGEITLDELKTQTKNWKNVVDGSDYMRKTYDELIEKANEALERNNMKSIPKRNNYMPHQGEMDSIMKMLGLESYDLPTDINGITANFKPNKNWFANALKRKGEQTVYDAVRGFDNYIEGVQRIIHHTDDIVRLRKLDKAIREKFSDTGSTHLSNFVSSLTDYTNLLAGKKSQLDRGFEEMFGRPVYRLADGVRKQVASNMIGANVSSALTNFIPLTQSLATTRKDSFIKGMVDTIGSRLKDDGFVNKSDYLTRRVGSDKLALNSWQKVQDKANWLFKVVDNFTGETIVRSKYYEGLKKGMNEESAMKYADNWAGKMMADRSIGMTPAIMNSKVVSLFAPFQTEVNNQMSFLFKDLPREYAGNKAALASVVGQIALYSYLFNTLYEKATGRRPAFDVVGVAEKAVKDFSNEDLPKGTAQKNLAQNVANQLPFSSVVTGGRIPIGSALPDVYKVATGESKAKDEFVKPLTYLLPPTGGGQAKKTLQGINAIKDEGVYNNSKSQLKYPVNPNTTNKVKGALFGTSSFKETQDYYNNGRSPLGSEQTKLLNAATGKTQPTKETAKDIKAKGYEGKTTQEMYSIILDDRKINKQKDNVYNIVDSLNDKKLKAKAQNEANSIIKKKLTADEKIKLLKELQDKYKAMQK